MINSLSSGCKQCMLLLRLLTLNNLQHNRRVFCQYVETYNNYLADALSRLQIKRFFSLASKDGHQVNSSPDPLPAELWPPSKLWIL